MFPLTLILGSLPSLHPIVLRCWSSKEPREAQLARRLGVYS